MRFTPEHESAALVTPALALQAARTALRAAAEGGVVFPPVLGHGADPTTRFSIKSGVLAGSSGLKIGSLWPGNPQRGLPAHSSLLLLFDEATGTVVEAIAASAANALRTAAADAVAAQALAREDSSTLAIFGAGRQALHEVLAVAEVRPIKTVLVVSRSPGPGEALAGRLAMAGFSAVTADARSACAAADIIVTATPARAPLFEGDWVRPGTHIAAMGADGPGKRELPPELLMRAELFCDLPSQSVVMGEFQSLAAEVAEGRKALIAIGDVLSGGHAGRSSRDAITAFDSSGIALQDIALALAIVALLPPRVAS